MLTARRKPRTEGEQWILCGHPRCRGQLGWITIGPPKETQLVARDATAPETVPDMKFQVVKFIVPTIPTVYLRETAIGCPCGIDIPHRFTVPRPESDQDGRAGAPDVIIAMSSDDLPCVVRCPRRGCGRESTVPREFAVDVLMVARPSRRGGERRRGYLTPEI